MQLIPVISQSFQFQPFYLNTKIQYCWYTKMVKLRLVVHHLKSLRTPCIESVLEDVYQILVSLAVDYHLCCPGACVRGAPTEQLPWAPRRHWNNRK
jgi:hypothetical protein